MIAAFGKHFVKTGHFSAAHHAALCTAFDQRNVGDYDQAEFPSDTAEAFLQNAEAFVCAAEAYLRQS